ncbi:hypothetical protein [Planctomicrobium piriforme]|uniref:Uncharacterized protein n=1 Tax=Planctomicrobium piriforme TaxID=1576369 RepID=A0A1I3BBS5_9PLAN|nr:hypothetical protein [Planctomicrobium piriforme]SFH59743.1 hypothetical protein SAMN05421753_101364 [Planctomicrobium piriforme]
MNSNDATSSQGLMIWRITTWVCYGIIVAAVLASVLLAAVSSTGLSRITVTALNPAAEPRDPQIPLMDANDVLPDYEIAVIQTSGRTTKLGAKPNTSAVDGLVWTLNEPVSTASIVGIRLLDQDQFVSDVVTEVQLTGPRVVSHDYQFDFETQRTLSLGIRSFFETPLGAAIVVGFLIAVIWIFCAAYWL